MKINSAFRLTVLMAAAILLQFAATAGWAGAAAKEAHPELDEQEMLISCADCHKEVSPDLEKEWYDSVHGIAMVKCYQCHGTFETFQVSPDKTNCAVCHGDQIEKKIAQGKQCWECHVPHSFEAEK